jgi:phosphoglycolate phosphatase
MLLIFDLDGTLIDSAEDLAIATNHTRARFGLEPLDAKVVHSYVGNGAAMLVRRALGPDPSEAVVEEGLDFFIKYYRAHALAHTRLYPGIEAAVKVLASKGHTLAVLTNKPVRISADIIAGLGLASLFKHVYGGNSFEQKKKPDPIGIETLMQETGFAPKETWMVGDSSVDVQTGRNAGVRVCGVTWGFQPESFAEFAPDVVVREAKELVGVFDRVV